MWRYPNSSAQRTASTHSGPLGTCQTPRPSSGIRLPSASVRTHPSAVSASVVIESSWSIRGAGSADTSQHAAEHELVDGAEQIPVEHPNVSGGIEDRGLAHLGAAVTVGGDLELEPKSAWDPHLR